MLGFMLILNVTHLGCVFDPDLGSIRAVDPDSRRPNWSPKKEENKEKKFHI
jgi:hypothetical protein